MVKSSSKRKKTKPQIISKESKISKISYLKLAIKDNSEATRLIRKMSLSMSDDLMPKLPKNLAKPKMTRINEENDNLISVESNLLITLNQLF